MELTNHEAYCLYELRSMLERHVLLHIKVE